MSLSTPERFGIPPKLKNLDAFLKFMSASQLGGAKIVYTDKYMSNDLVVLMVRVSGAVEASRVGMGDKGLVKFASRGVSVLRIVDGKVIRHTDYFDYPSLVESFKRQE